MQLIIPMTGEGSRFVAASYERLKPFILIHHKPLLYWVLKMFPSIEQSNIILIIRRAHFENYSYIQNEINLYAAKAKIVLVDHFDKRGPVPNILQAANHINDLSPTFVSYCDFYMQWDFKKYLHELTILNPDGAIPCYTGFHPHLLPKENLYACAKTTEDNYLIEIKEKFSFTEDKFHSLHSPGVYYYKHGSLLKKYYQKAMEDNLSTQGEFYCSLPYNFMVQDKLKIHVPTNVHHFCQWGTPQDLSNYLFCINTLLKKNSNLVYDETLSYWRDFFKNEDIKAL